VLQEIAPEGHTVRASTSTLAKLLAWQQEGALEAQQVSSGAAAALMSCEMWLAVKCPMCLVVRGMPSQQLMFWAADNATLSR
jgi:hypothetical protein